MLFYSSDFSLPTHKRKTLQVSRWLFPDSLVARLLISLLLSFNSAPSHFFSCGLFAIFFVFKPPTSSLLLTSSSSSTDVAEGAVEREDGYFWRAR